MLQKTMFTAPIIRPMLRGFSRATLKLLGWKVVGSMPPEIKQCVLIAAPHTSNWDMPLSLMIAFSLDTQLHWVGKQSIFKFPFGGLMRWMGGIPVDRSHSNNMVSATIDKFKELPELRIMMSPEGTRARVTQWKSGFYHIAHGAQVPVALAFVDYKNKRGGIGKFIITSGDYDKDMIDINAFYKPLCD